MQVFDELPRRIDNGPAKFGNDWCGVFIRGDSTGPLIGALKAYRDIPAENEPRTIWRRSTCDTWIGLLEAAQEI